MAGTKTYVAKPGEVAEKWWVVDASDKVVGRLAPGVAFDVAATEMERIGAQMAREFRDTNDLTSVAVLPLHTVSPQSRLLLAALIGASLCVLVIACINLATLLLTRARERLRRLSVSGRRK